MKCPCGSEEIVKFRLDSDWASDAGDMSLVNDPEVYSEDTIQRVEDGRRLDVKCFICFSCGNCF